MYLFYEGLFKLVFGKRGGRMTCDSIASAFTPEELQRYLYQSNLEGARVAKYYVIPSLLEALLGVERVHKSKTKAKKTFPETITITLPFLGIPGKKYLD